MKSCSRKSRTAALTVFRLQMRQTDIGRIIGRNGQTIRAIRALLSSAAARHGQKRRWISSSSALVRILLLSPALDPRYDAERSRERAIKRRLLTINIDADFPVGVDSAAIHPGGVERHREVSVLVERDQAAGAAEFARLCRARPGPLRPAASSLIPSRPRCCARRPRG